MPPLRIFAAYLTVLLFALPAIADDDKDAWDVDDIPGKHSEIRIDVERGTWMSLDVSPDGSRIACIGDAGGNNTVEHNLPQKMLYDDVLQFWSQTNVAYTPTLLVTLGGLTAETYSYQETEVWKHPLPSRFVPPQVLQARAVRRTLAAEEDCRFDDSANTARLLADLVVIDADLPEDIYNSDRVTRAMLNGRLYEAETLNEIITGQRKTRPFWWQ